MTDLELTRLAAESMGYRITEEPPLDGSAVWCHLPNQHGVWFQPLRNDAQAMELVKRFGMEVRFNEKRGDNGEWIATPSYKAEPSAYAANLNRAIVECVANMQKGKP